MASPRRTFLREYLLATAIAAGSACAPHLPQTYRLAPDGNAHILVPPGVATAEVKQGVFTVTLAKGKPPCTPTADAIHAQQRSGKLRVEVAHDALLQQPAGWLRQWVAEAEARGCIPPGAGMEFATRILESVPLDPSAGYRLLHADNIREGFVELGPENRLQATAPIMKSGASVDTPLVEIASVSGSGNNVNVDLKTSSSLIGVETSWYALQPKTDGPGAKFVALSAERKIEGRAEPAAAPLQNYFQFTPQIGFYRLLYKSDSTSQGAVTEIVVGAPDRVELDRRTKLILADPNACKVSDPALCSVIPRHVAVNPYLAVTVNGQEIRLDNGKTVRAAITAGGGPRRAEEVLPSLSVLKPYGGKLVPVEFDRSQPTIIDLALLGGESITWK